nr:C-terminal binding protein AN-like [Tanacetum cinerariifolium]
MTTTVKRDLEQQNRSMTSSSLPLIITLNCIEDTTLESQYLSTLARVEHVPLHLLADSNIEHASAVLLHSLAFLPRAAQRRLRPYQLILCLGSADRAVDSAIASELGLGRLVHVDVSRAEEVADTVMALFLGLLRRTHLLSRHALSASGWLGSVQPLCRGMRRCRGLVLGIVGRSGSAKSLAIRSLAFKISVLYYDVNEVHIWKVSETLTARLRASELSTRPFRQSSRLSRKSFTAELQANPYQLLSQSLALCPSRRRWRILLLVTFIVDEHKDLKDPLAFVLLLILSHRSSIVDTPQQMGLGAQLKQLGQLRIAHDFVLYGQSQLQSCRMVHDQVSWPFML